MSVTLDPLALTAAINAFRDTLDDHIETLDSADQDTIARAVRESIEAYIVTANATGTTHALSIIPGGVPGYEPLAKVLELAFDQSAKGKGKQRHGRGLPFLSQPIFSISRMVGLGGLTYQIAKKAQEAMSMELDGKPEAAQAELLGVIVYAAAAHILIQEKGQ